MTSLLEQSRSSQNGREGSTQVKKRNRAVLSCITCHQRRVKCNRVQPCEACINYGCADGCTFAEKPSKKPRRKASKDGTMTSTGEGSRHSSGYDDSSSASPENSFRESNQFGALHMQQLPQLPPPPPPAPPSQRTSDNYTESYLPVASFHAFVERFQKHTTQESDKTNDLPPIYPSQDLAMIHAARCDLPLPERSKMLILFFIEHLDYYYETADYDEMTPWLMPFLHKLRNDRSPSLEVIREGDATRLCLVMILLAAYLQVAGEGLISMYFMDAEPAGFSLTNLTRKTVKDTYEAHIVNLLDIATLRDGPSPDLLRCSITYIHFLKNEGRHGDSGKRPLLASVATLVEQIGLYRDPAPSVAKRQRESLRRLFWTFYSFDRMTSAHLGYEVRITDDRITTKEPPVETYSPTLGRRSHLAQIYRIKLCRISGKLGSVIAKNSASTQTVDMIEADLQAYSNALPLELQPHFPDLQPEQYELRNFDLQRRMLYLVHCSIRGGLHRLCFFPSEAIPMDQVQRSRRVCVEAARDMITTIESVRFRTVNVDSLRCFYMPYFILESAITLVLTSLIELGGVPSGREMPESIQTNMRSAMRGREILATLPADFLPATQGLRLISRVLSKATQIMELHAQQKLSYAESKTAIRDVLCDEDGKRIALPFSCTVGGPPANVALQSAATRTNTIMAGNSSDTSARTPSDGLTHSSSFSDVTSLTTPPADFASTATASGLPTSVAMSNNNFYAAAASTPSRLAGNPVFVNLPGPTEEPTYRDLNLDFFNSLASALPNPFSTEESESHQTASPYVPHDATAGNMDLDQQMELWLASLQTFT